MLRRFDGKQACNDDLDAAVDAFFAGTLDARVASLDDDDTTVDRTRATRDGASVDRAGRREENADDAMVISDGEGTMDEDSDDYWDDDGSSPIDLMGEDDDDPNPWNTATARARGVCSRMREVERGWRRENDLGSVVRGRRRSRLATAATSIYRMASIARRREC